MLTKTITPQTQELFEKLNDDVITISWKWQIIRSLYGTQERVDLLSATAPSFFQVCQTTFADDVYLMLSRITDSPKTYDQENLVIARLIDSVDPSQDPVFYQKLKQMTDAAILACLPFRKHRHKRLAHSELNFKLQTSANLIPNISVAEINRAIEALQKLLNEFCRYFFQRDTSYKVIENGGVKALVTYLQKGVDAVEKEKQQALAAHGA